MASETNPSRYMHQDRNKSRYMASERIKAAGWPVKNRNRSRYKVRDMNYVEADRHIAWNSKRIRDRSRRKENAGTWLGTQRQYRN